jgi:hypothetical protein
LPKGKKDPAFRTKPQLALELIEAAVGLGVPFRAVVADCWYGDNVNFEAGLWQAGLPWVVSLKPAKGSWAPADQAHTPEEAARRLRWRDPRHPGDWTPVERHFRDGHTQTWYAADLVFSGYGPERLVRLVVATTDPATLPPINTWYLSTNLPAPGSQRAADSPHAPADLAEVVRLYGLRNWVEQGYKQVKDELGWADFMVRSDRAIRRHWQLVCCAFSFCWQAWFAEEAPTAPTTPPARVEPAVPPQAVVVAGPPAGRGKNADRCTSRSGLPRPVASDPPPRARLVGSVDLPLALVARLVHGAPASSRPGAPPRPRHRPSPPPLLPGVTNYR